MTDVLKALMAQLSVVAVIVLGVLAFLLLWKMLDKSVESGAVVQAISEQVIEHILGNAQILIILILGTTIFLTLWYHPDSEKAIALVSNIVSGLLGMAMNQAINNAKKNGGFPVATPGGV